MGASGGNAHIGLDDFSLTPAVAPTLTTNAATAATTAGTTFNATISSLGSPTASTDYGFLYSTTVSAAGSLVLPGNGSTIIKAQKGTTGATAAAYNVAQTGLAANTLYYVQAYAANSAGPGYGGVVNATTLASVSSTTDASPGQTTAAPGGTVAVGGGASITERGVFYSLTNGFADGAGTKVIASVATGTGAFTSSLSGLTASTTYYVKAYATNAGGTSYGSQVSFTTAPAAANTITTGAVTGAPVCATTATDITVAYTTTGTLTGTYSLELSDASGSFPGTTLVATAGTAGSSITATVPAGTTSSTLYKVRVNNDAPATTGSASAAFTIISNTAVTVAGSSPQALTIATGPTTGTALTASSASAVAPTYQWYYSTTAGNNAAATAIGGATAASYTPTVADLGTAAGTYYVSVRANYPGCGAVVGTPEATVTVANPTPVITATPSTLSGFTYVVGSGPSTPAQPYNLSGQYLTPVAGNLTVTATGTAYEVSLSSGSGYSATTLLVPYTSSTLAATPVYVRLKAGQAVASYNSQLIANSGGGATAQNVTVSGSVTSVPPTITVNPTSLALGTVGVNTPGTISTYTVSGSNLGTTPISILAPSGVELSLNGFVTSAATTLSLPPTAGSVATTTISVRIAAAASGTGISGNIANTAGATTQNVAVTGTVAGAAPPCPSTGFEGGTFPPTGFTISGAVTSNSNSNTGAVAASFGTAGATLNFPVIANPNSVTFYLSRSSSANLRGLDLKVSTDGTTYNTLISYSSGGATPVGLSPLYTTYTVDLSAYNASSTVYLQFVKTGANNPFYLDDISVNCGIAAPAFTLTTGSPSGAPYCINEGATAAISVPFTVSGGSFGTGNVFTATLSDATGSFATETTLGTLAGVTSGTIAGTIPNATLTGTGYRVRVKASAPATTAANNGTDLVITKFDTNEVDLTSLGVQAGNGTATLTFTGPALCATGAIVTIRQGSTGTKPLSSTTYTANTVFGSTGSQIAAGQYVVYNGAKTGTVTVTGLTNGQTYYFQVFTTAGSGYSDGRQKLVRPVAPATLTEVVVPQLISGGAGTTRLPYVWNVTLSGLVANTTYKYYTAARAAADAAGYGGVGVPIETKVAGTFVRGSGPGLVAGSSTFTTDGTGAYAGWFGLEASTDARFADGNVVYPMIVLNGGGGAADNIETYYLPTTSAVTAKALGTGATQATGVRGNSFGTPSNFVLIYDNTAGTGRPLAGTFIERDGSVSTASYAALYGSVEGVAGAYGLLTPNTNANGIRRVEQRSLADGSVVVGCPATDADGTWPGGAATASPSGGNTTTLVFTTGDTPFLAATVAGLSPASPSTIQQNATLTITGANFTTGPRPTITFTGGATATAATVDAAGTSLTVVVPGGAQSGTVSVTAGCGTVATSVATITVVPLVFYTVTGATDLSLLASFTANADGSVGTVPASFTTANQVFNVLGTGRSFASNWTVSGTNSKVVLTANASLIIPTTAYFSGLIDQLANSTLVIQNTSTAAISNLFQGVQDATSTIELAQAGTYAVPPTNGASYSLVYANLQLTNGIKTIPAPASGLVVNGNLTLSNTQVSGAVANASNQASSYSAIQLYGSYNQLSGVTYNNAAFSVNLQLMNESTAQNLNANGNTIALYRLYTAAVSGAGSGTNSNAVGGILTGTGSVLELGNSFDGGLALYESSASLALNAGTTLRFVANGGGNIFVGTNGLLKPDPLANLEFNRNTSNTYSLGVLRFASGFTTVNNFALNTTAPGAANTLTLTSDLTVNGTATIQAGTLVIGANTLTLNGSLSVLTGGFLNGSGSSNLTVGGTGTFGTLSFASGAQLLNNLTMNRTGGTLTLGAPLTVDNILTLTNGIISTKVVNLLTLTRTTAGAVVGGSASSFVSGPLARATATGTAAVVFPIGKDAAYRPLTLNTAAQSSTRTYVAEQFNSTARTNGLSGGLTRVSNVRYFGLNPVAATGTFSGTVTLSFGADDLVNYPQDNSFVMAKRPTGGGTWTNIGRTSATGANVTTPGTYVASGSLTSAAFTTFSDFSLASTAPASNNAAGTLNPLPVELTAFTAVRTAASTVALAWTTASERNTARFEVERSTDGKAFARLGEVAAQGNKATPTAYAYLDANARIPAYSGSLYYRLRQVDADGIFAYSAVRVVAAPGSSLVVYPNPASTVLHLATAPEARYRVLSLTGQVLLSGTAATGQADVAVAGLPAGLYLVEVTTATGRQTQKFTKE